MATSDSPLRDMAATFRPPVMDAETAFDLFLSANFYFDDTGDR